LAVLKDPGNKEVLARDLHPDDYVNQINYQKASGAILERKIQRLRNVSEEIRKYAVIMEGVIPGDQLSPRIRMRLTQLLREWNNEPEQELAERSRMKVKRVNKRSIERRLAPKIEMPRLNPPLRFPHLAPRSGFRVLRKRSCK